MKGIVLISVIIFNRVEADDVCDQTTGHAAQQEPEPAAVDFFGSTEASFAKLFELPCEVAL